MLVITPSCRPERLPWILANWNRQRKEASDCLLIAWNGCEPPVDPPTERGVMSTFVGETGNIGAAMDAGIAFARRAGHRSWICFDDDDWYGPRAMELAKLGLARADVVGRTSKFYRATTGEIWLLTAREGGLDNDFGLSTMAAHTTIREPFDDGGPSWGVETRWLARVSGKVRFAQLPLSEFVYCRWSDVAHTTIVSDAAAAFMFDCVRNFGVQPFEICTIHETELPPSYPLVFDVAEQMRDLIETAKACGSR